MHLTCVGVNHKSAPVEIRELVGLSESAIRSSISQLVSIKEVSECVILSTCNRTEIYAIGNEIATPSALQNFFSDRISVVSDDDGHLYTYNGIVAVKHLYEVACGLDSLVIGEPQILKQIKDAYDLARDVGSTGSHSHSLFQGAIATGKRARAETKIGAGGFSVGNAAVDLASRVFGKLNTSRVMILGAGKMSELTAKHLRQNGVQVVIVANRTFDKAERIANRLGGMAIKYSEFENQLVQTDIVISSTSSPTYIISKQMVLNALKLRRGRPIILIDIAVPRDIEPTIAGLDNVFLYDIDDLHEVVADLTEDRKSETDAVKNIIDQEILKYRERILTNKVAPFILGIKNKHDDIRLSEISRLRNQMPHLTDAEWRNIDAAMRSLVTRISKDPIEQIKAIQNSDEIMSPTEVAYRLFQLETHIHGTQEEPTLTTIDNEPPAGLSNFLLEIPKK